MAGMDENPYKSPQPVSPPPSRITHSATAGDNERSLLSSGMFWIVLMVVVPCAFVLFDWIYSIYLQFLFIRE